MRIIYGIQTQLQMLERQTVEICPEQSTLIAHDANTTME